MADMSRRPIRGETDDDLIRLQEEFLAKKEKPSVNIKSFSKPLLDSQQNVQHEISAGKSLSSYLKF